MRRLSGCFFGLLLVTALSAVLVARGPGLAGLPVPPELERFIDVLAQRFGGDGETREQPPVPPPTSVPPPPTETTNPPTPTPAPSEITLTLEVLGAAGTPVDHVIDGNAVTLTARVTNASSATVAGPVYFSLKPLSAGGALIGQCEIEAASSSEATCTAPVAADGWAWREHTRVERRTVYASLIGYPASAALAVPVTPKPAVLIHGFTSNAATWSAWTGQDGFLAQWDIPGYAVGDGQFNIEPMDTGDFDQPRRPTNSIAENASIIARYVEEVRRSTGAERVDLVAHSMGGLISRYYVSLLMPLVEREDLPSVPAVNQLYMIGTPNAGTPCAVPPATLGLYPPATTQLTPAYVQHLFNPQTSDPRQVPFFVLAGDPVHDYAALVCTSVPTDVFVSVASAARAIPVAAEIMPVRHGEQTKSPAVFATVLESFARDPSQYPIPLPPKPAMPSAEDAALQMSLIDSGTLATDTTTTVDLSIDDAETVSFQLYAPSQDVEMTIIDTAGRRITTESADELSGVSAATAKDQETVATQGVKVEKPGAGRWQVVVKPKAGAKQDAIYAVAAFLQSDLRLTVDTPAPVVEVGQPAPIRARLSGPVAVKTVAATAQVRDAHGDAVGKLTLHDDGAHNDGAADDGVFVGEWAPTEAGLYTIAVTAAGESEAGNAFQRLGMLAIEVRPAPPARR